MTGYTARPKIQMNFSFFQDPFSIHIINGLELKKGSFL